MTFERPHVQHLAISNNLKKLRKKMMSRAIIVLGVFFYASSNAFLKGGLGVAARDIGISEVEVGIILSLGALLVIPTAPIWGVISELVDRRTLVLVSLPMVAVGPLAMALVFSNSEAQTAASAFWLLVVARSIKGVFGGALLTTTQALVADTTSTDQRVAGMGMMGASVTAGALFGSLLLWLTADYGIAVGFSLFVFGFFFALVISFFRLPQVHSKTDKARSEPVPIRNVWRYFLMTFLGFASYAMIAPTIGLRLQDGLNLSSTEAIASAGLVLALTTCALTVSQLTIAACKVTVSPFLFWGAGSGVILGLYALFASESVFSTAVAMILIGGSLGCMIPSVVGGLSLAAGSGAQGKAAGLNIAFRGLGVAVGPIIGTMAYRIDMNAPLFGAGVAMLLALLISNGNRQTALS